MVFGCRTNPAAQAEAQHENKLRCLELECDRLRERVRVLEEERTRDVTHVAGSSAEEVQGTGCFMSFGSLLVQASWEEWKRSTDSTKRFLSVSEKFIYLNARRL
jgi:hypothetical protein